MLADQWSKSWALAALADQPSFSVIGDFLQFTLVFNRGGALGTNLGSSTYYLISGSLILLFLLWYIFIHREDRLYAWPLSFIAGGAVGNLIDRVQLGQVVDFIDVDFFDINIFDYQLYRFWTFNIADSAISCAIVFLLVVILIHPKKKIEPETAISSQSSQ